MSDLLKFIIIFSFLFQSVSFVGMSILFSRMLHVFNEVLKCVSDAADELAPELHEEDPT